MSKHTYNQPPVVPGQARVESRVAVWLQCPLCQQEHKHILTARDHPDLPGTRYWPIDCHGNRYIMGVSASSIANALTLARTIATVYGLNQQWLTQETEETCCPSTAT